jgi:uncharacterized membrane protein YqjE
MKDIIGDKGMLTIFILFGLIWLIIAVILSFWVYEDAESRGMEGILWIAVMLLLGLIGLIIYLIVRGEKEVTREKIHMCQSCGRIIKEKDVKYCPFCGEDL